MILPIYIEKYGILYLTKVLKIQDYLVAYYPTFLSYLDLMKDKSIIGKEDPLSEDDLLSSLSVVGIRGLFYAQNNVVSLFFLN
jgi:hypothetical protein